LALIVVEQCQVVEADRHVGMLRAQGVFPDRQRPLVKRLTSSGGSGQFNLAAGEVFSVADLWQPPSVFPDFRPFTILSRVWPVGSPGNPHE
jgi:hypothetical protein